MLESMKKPETAHSSVALCSVCQSSITYDWVHTNRKSYGRCPECWCVSMNPQYLLNPEEEQARYAQHNNSMENRGYVEYLTAFADNTVRRVLPMPSVGEATLTTHPEQSAKLNAMTSPRATNSIATTLDHPDQPVPRTPQMSQMSQSPQVPQNPRVLDFGSGPTPVFAQLLQGWGYDVTIYDPYFAPSGIELGVGKPLHPTSSTYMPQNPAPPRNLRPSCTKKSTADWQNKTYDAITSIEVFEHLTDPLTTLQQLAGLLQPGGHLCIRTLLHYNDQKRFCNWWYPIDNTHITFFHAHTFAHMAKQCGLVVISIKNGCEIILQKG